MEVAEVTGVIDRIVANVEQVVYGKRRVVQQTLAAMLAGGHVLLEDVPGVGKTLLAKALARSVGGAFKRVQFTPDLLPADITGVTIYDQREETFRFRPGPVFSNVLLADEINRASPKTQSALLECMEERTVSVDGTIHAISQPFLVLATQNPIEHEGVYPLPESQLDRFMLRLRLGYPAREHERALLRRTALVDPVDALAPVADPAIIVECQRRLSEVHCDERLSDYLLDLVEATRRSDRVRLGASPRAAITLARAARGLALVEGRDYVRPDDIQAQAPAVLGHRLVLTGTAAGGSSGEAFVRDLLQQVPAP